MIKIMKLSASIIIFILPLIVSARCTTEEAALPENNVTASNPKTSELMKDTIEIIIGSAHFTAVLESNAAATEFIKMLPLTVNMKDLNSNEKFFDLSNSLPANPSNPRTINSGDLMLWGSNTLVLFYKTLTLHIATQGLEKLKTRTAYHRH